MQTIVNDVTRTMTATINRLHPARLRALVLAVLIVCLGATPISMGAAHTGDHPANTGQAAAAVAAVERSHTATGQAADHAAEQAASRTQPRDSAPVAPVAGLDQTQMNHAKTIIDTAEQMKLPKKAAVIAVATSMQETNLRNLANTGLPESENLPNDGTGYDHDSVGLFQQRPASGWGPVDQLMDPATSAKKFYQALDQVPGWQDMPVTVAAQTVQGSAFPDAYAQHEPAAQAVVNAINKK
jgi:hypothetical protein